MKDEKAIKIIKSSKASKAIKTIKAVGERVLDMIYPITCPFCNEISKKGICLTCRDIVKPIVEPRCFSCGKPVSKQEQEFCYDCSRANFIYDQGKSLYLHQEKVAGGLYELKYFNQRINGKIFGKELAVNFQKEIKRWKIEEIVPIPMHYSKEKKRGFNQSEVIANELGKCLNIPVNTDLVYRIKATKPLKDLEKEQRISNLDGAFGIPRNRKIPKIVLLVDDIYTTGVTINKVAKILKKAGCEKVYFLTVSIGQGL
jgi:ComF family protein